MRLVTMDEVQDFWMDRKTAKIILKLKPMNLICPSCNWRGTDQQLQVDLPNIPDLGQRLDIGSEVPAGECPECGALCYWDRNKKHESNHPTIQ